MKERPILFQGDMVRALLDGSKTQTRRMCKPQPVADARFSGGYFIPGKGKGGVQISVEAPYVGIACPYGKPGDRLWVREAWRTLNVHDHVPPRELTGAKVSYDASTLRTEPSIWWGKKRPSIFMPRWASRITLEITDVRVERLQDISEADAEAEGCDRLTWDGTQGPADLIDWPLKTVDRPWANGYALLWESINGDDSWAANPWVWAVSFRRLP